MRRFLPCRLGSALLTDLDEGALPWGLALRTRLHLLTCRSCRNLHRDLRALARLLAPATVRAPEPLAPPPLVLGPLPRTGAGPAPRRSWPATPLPASLDQPGQEPGPALGRMVQVHAALASQRRRREPGPELPPWLLTLLPPPGEWAWRWRRRGARQAVVQAEPGGVRLVLGWAPAGARLLPRWSRKAGSCLILQGAAGRPRVRYGPGDWVAATPAGESLGALPPGCWYLLEEGRPENPNANDCYLSY